MSGNPLNPKFWSVTAYIFISVALFHPEEAISATYPDETAGINEEQTVRVYIGTYPGKGEPGIYYYEYDLSEKKFTKKQEVSGQASPGFLALCPRSRFLYAVNQIADFNGKNEGAVSSFSIDKRTGMLTYINSTSSMGPRPCHLSVTPDGNFVAAANYSGGSVVLLPVADDGSLGEATGFIQHEGSGPHPSRQNAPHAHSIYPSPCGKYLFSADLGTDKIMIYTYDGSGKLIPNHAAPYARMEPGAGPRHMAIHPGKNWIYVVNELNSTITRLIFEPETGDVRVMESVSTLPQGFDGVNYCAEIRVHPDGRFLYASNRGHNSIAIFEISDHGIPVAAGHENVRGDWPRNFNIDPSGKILIVANQNSGNIAVFDINRETGNLTFTGKMLEIKQPVCIVF